MKGGNPDLQSSPIPNQGGVNINGKLRKAGVFMGPDYHNPNPWVRILGRANESEIEIDGIKSKALIDSGAMISMMSKEYCDTHGYEIHPLDQLVPIEGSGGADVPYLGYVKVRMQIPGISSFEWHVLMLVSHTTTHYHKWVAIQVGSQIIDQVVKDITDEELRSLSQSWKLAYVGTILSKSSQVGNNEFDLGQVKGNVVITKKVTNPTFQTVIVKGLMKVTGHHKHVHALMKSSPKCQNIFVPGNTTELKLGGLQADVVLWNLSGRVVTLEPHTEVGKISAVNKVPPTLTTKVIEENIPDDEYDEKIQCKSAQVDLSNSKSKQVKEDPEEILQKVDLLGITDWDPAEQCDACNLLSEYACIFSQNDLDLGKTLIVKHSIKLTDSTPFKEHY